MGNQTELEHKYASDEIGMREFCQKMMLQDPDSYADRKTFDDVYYKRGASILRHRLVGDGELTVKERKSPDSIEDRVEVNLCFSKKTDRLDVEEFLRLTGYERMFTLKKLYVQVFYFVREDYTVEVARYATTRKDEWGESNYRKFIEVEVKRNDGSDYTDNQLKGVLAAWRDTLKTVFHLDEPLNESLLEIYSKLTSPSSAVGTHYRI